MLTFPTLLLCQYPADAVLEPAGGWRLPDADDQQRLRGYSKASARTQFALSRLLLAQATDNLLDGAGCGWKLVSGSSGQPMLRRADMSELPISLSHTPGLIAVALAPATTSVGVDVEAWTRPLRLERLLEASMSTQDAARCLSHAQPQQAFIRHWTLKEAYLKSLGKGIATDLRALSFSLETAAIGLQATPFGDDQYWYFEQPSVFEGYCISVAYAAPQPAIASWHEVAIASPIQLTGCQLRLLQYR